MSYEYIPAVGFALTTALAVWRWNVTSDKLKAARERITENETDLANFAEYKRKAELWDEAQAKAKPRKSTAKSKK